MNRFEYVRAGTVAEAVQAFASGAESRFIAGGTNLVDLMKYNVERPGRLVDITRLPLDSIGLTFSFDPVTGQGHFSGTLPGNISGPLPIRVTATDPGGLSVTDTFIINVQPTNSPPNGHTPAAFP